MRRNCPAGVYRESICLGPLSTGAEDVLGFSWAADAVKGLYLCVYIYIGIVEKKMETSIMGDIGVIIGHILGLYKDSGFKGLEFRV